MIYSDSNIGILSSPNQDTNEYNTIMNCDTHAKKKHKRFCQKVFCLFIDLKYEYDQHTWNVTKCLCFTILVVYIPNI